MPLQMNLPAIRPLEPLPRVLRLQVSRVNCLWMALLEAVSFPGSPELPMVHLDRDSLAAGV